MAKFNFRLQSLLNVKIQMEDNLKNELAKAMRKLEKEKGKLEQLKIAEEKCIEEFNLNSVRPTTVENLKKYNLYISHLRDRIAKQKENVNSAQVIVDKIRRELIKVVQEREMLDKLKEKKYSEYLDELAKKEQRSNDEVVSYRHNKLTGDENG